MSWTVTSNQPWLAVSPASGSGARDLSVTVAPGALTTPGTAVGSITITLSGAGNLVAPVGVTLVTMIAGTSVAPIGVVDTPLANATGVVGAIPVTGWALDDVEVASVFVCRNAVAGESAAPDGRCGGAAQMYLGDAVFIDDARPDVAAAFPAYPRNYRGGWGFMLLTNMLPNQGNGAYTLSASTRWIARAASSRSARGRLTCDNAHATPPVRRHRHAGAGRHGVGCELRQLRMGADASSQVHPERRLDHDRLRRRRGVGQSDLQQLPLGHRVALSRAEQHERRHRLPRHRYDRAHERLAHDRVDGERQPRGNRRALAAATSGCRTASLPG